MTIDLLSEIQAHLDLQKLAPLQIHPDDFYKVLKNNLHLTKKGCCKFTYRLKSLHQMIEEDSSQTSC